LIISLNADPQDK